MNKPKTAISLPASIMEHWISKDPARLKRWIDIIFSMDDSGQVTRSFGEWGKRWNLSKDSARNFINILVKQEMLKIDTLHDSYTILTRLTICNFELYLTSLHDSYTVSTRLTCSEGTEKKTIKSEPKKKTKEVPEPSKVFTECIKIYNDFILSKTGNPAKIDGQQGNAMKSIIAYFNTNPVVKNKDDVDKAIIEAWKGLLDNYHKWDIYKRQGKIKLSQISSEIINIVHDIKTNRNNLPGTLIGVVPKESFANKNYDEKLI